MVATTGSIADKPVAHLLAHALRGRVSGSLEIVACGGALSAMIVLRRGLIAKIRTSRPVAYLGAVLYELGSIDSAELDASLLELAARRTLHGEVLLARGSITREELEEGLREQALRKLIHVFGFDDDARFAFRPDVDDLGSWGGDDPVLVDPCPALWRGIREFSRPADVRGVLERIAALRCSLAPGADVHRFHFEDDELAVVSCLGMKPFRVAELRGLGLLSPAATDLLVYCLVITNQVELVEGAGRQGAPQHKASGFRARLDPSQEGLPGGRRKKS